MTSLPQETAVLSTQVVPDLPSFGRYRVVGELGAGGMGTVYRGFDDRLRREVAIKTILMVRGADELLQRFRQEARAVGALAHPNIIAVYDIDTAEGAPFMVLELAAGGSLKQRLQRGPVDAATVRTVGIQVGRALAAAHERGILHRDVKPANILETEPGTFKLADFGIARLPDSTMTVSGSFLGSPAYAAPEALERGAFSPASDVYGLAATLYELLGGEPPHGRHAGLGSLIAALQHPPRSLAVHAHVPADLAAVIMSALARDPAARPSAGDLARALSASPAAMSIAPAPVAVPVAAVTLSTMAGPPGPDRRKRLLLASALLGLLAIGGIAALAGGSSSRAARPSSPSPAVAPAVAPAVTPASFDAAMLADDSEVWPEDEAEEDEAEEDGDLDEAPWPEEQAWEQGPGDRGNWKGKGKGKHKGKGKGRGH